MGLGVQPISTGGSVSSSVPYAPPIDNIRRVVFAGAAPTTTGVPLAKSPTQALTVSQQRANSLYTLFGGKAPIYQ